MPRDFSTVRIKRIEGEEGRFHVESQSGQGTYVVDLFEHSHGICTCDHFMYRQLGNAMYGREYFNCKHIDAVLAFLKQGSTGESQQSEEDSE
jgi:hypothetical protein